MDVGLHVRLDTSRPDSSGSDDRYDATPSSASRHARCFIDHARFSFQHSVKLYIYSGIEGLRMGALPSASRFGVMLIDVRTARIRRRRIICKSIHRECVCGFFVWRPHRIYHAYRTFVVPFVIEAGSALEFVSVRPLLRRRLS